MSNLNTPGFLKRATMLISVGAKKARTVVKMVAVSTVFAAATLSSPVIAQTHQPNHMQVTGAPATVVTVRKITDRNAAAVQRQTNRATNQVRNTTRSVASKAIGDALGGGQYGRTAGNIIGSIGADTIMNQRNNARTPLISEITVNIQGMGEFVVQQPAQQNYMGRDFRRGDAVIVRELNNGQALVVPASNPHYTPHSGRNLPRNMRPR